MLAPALPILAVLVALAPQAPSQTVPLNPLLPAPPAWITPPANGEKSSSSLVTRVLHAGSGSTHPGPSDYVTFHYTGWTRDGRVFDSTRGKDPVLAPLERLMKGMKEGLQSMVAGETRRMWVPEAQAFAGASGRPAGDLVLEVELLAVDPPPSQAPPDVAKVPGTARVSPSSLAFQTLRQGTGTTHPARRSYVTVHYTGWTTDGKMFDSSIARGRSATFRLDEVVKGWTEGLQMMVKGEKCRFWIPEKLAYRGEPGKPAGMLVFDVELLAFWE